MVSARYSVAKKPAMAKIGIKARPASSPEPSLGKRPTSGRWKPGLRKGKWAEDRKKERISVAGGTSRCLMRNGASIEQVLICRRADGDGWAFGDSSGGDVPGDKTRCRKARHGGRSC